MQQYTTKAQRTIAILSPDYLERVYTYPEWAAAFAKDPKGEEKTLVPVRVCECDITGLLKQIIYIDMVGINDEKTAVEKLLSGIAEERVKPTHKPRFPTDKPKPATEYTPYFPNSPDITLTDKYLQLLTSEFQAVNVRRDNPAHDSSSCALLFGHNFPFGKDEVRTVISRCAVAYDVEQFLAATVGNYHAPNASASETFIPNIVYKAASIRWRILVSLVADGLTQFRKDVLLEPLLSGVQSEKVERNVSFQLQQAARNFVQDPDSNSNFMTTSKILYLVGIICRDNDIDFNDLLAEEQQKYRYQILHPAVSKMRAMQTATITIYFKDREGAYEAILKALSEQHINIVASSSWTLLPERVACSKLELSFPTKIALESELQFVFTKSSVYGDIYSFAIQQS